MGKVPFHVSVATCAAAILPSVGYAATDAEVEALRSELAALKAQYAERMSALEAQIQQLQAKTDVAATPAVDSSAPATADAGPAAPATVARSASAFNPAISLILAGN